MKIKILLAFTILLIHSGCEKTVIAYPGNTQDTTPKAPEGAIKWLIDVNDVNDEEHGQLQENEQPATIGILTAKDDNPDDEVTFSLASQTVDGRDVNFFTVTSDSGSGKLILNSNDLDFESNILDETSRLIKLGITATDDSFDSLYKAFDVFVQITDENEAPEFQNFNSILQVADEHVEYTSVVNYFDVDTNSDVTVTINDGWLKEIGGGLLEGTPTSDHLGPNSFVVTLDDGLNTVTANLNIDVRNNEAPEFTNAPPSEFVVRVGDCSDVNTELFNITWFDPNGAGIDDVIFSHTGIDGVIDNLISLEELTGDQNSSKIEVIQAPENSDEGVFPVLLKIQDDRPVVSQLTEYEFNLIIQQNSPPEFINLTEFPSEISVGDTLEFSVEWQDPDNDAVDFTTSNPPSSLNFTAYSNGSVVAIPTQSWEWQIAFTIFDGCTATERQRTLTVNN